MEGEGQGVSSHLAVSVLVLCLLFFFSKMGCCEGNFCCSPSVNQTLLIRAESMCAVRVCSRFSLSAAVVLGATWNYNWGNLSFV